MDSSLKATRLFSEEDIDVCGQLTQDFGVHHMVGHEGRRMAQGALTLSALPLFGVPGVQVREVSLTFLAPVYAGDTVTATLDVIRRAELADDLVELHCQFTVTSGGQTPVITGSGVALLPRALARSQFRDGTEPS